MKKQEETDHKRLVNAFTKADVTSLIDKLPKGPDTLLFKIMDKMVLIYPAERNRSFQ